MKTKIITLFAIALVGVLISLSFVKRTSIAYINTYQVYNEFKLRKELEVKLESTKLKRKVLLDSVKAKIQMMILNVAGAKDAPNENIEGLKKSYFQKEKQYNEENEAQAQQYTDQVWEQLNQYIKEFGNEKNFDFILGANGQGNLMFAKESKDVTKELIEYVNDRYHGNK